MTGRTKIFALLAGLAGSLGAQSPAAKPTIVLVHGAFADSSSWNGVIADLQRDGYPVVSASNPLRGVISDATYVASVVKTVKGPVVLVGHSYGGAVIGQAAAGADNVKSLVFVDAFTLDTGEAIGAINAKFPAPPLGSALMPQPLPGGGQELYIRQDRFPVVFAPDLPRATARLLAAEQRPISAASFSDKPTAAAWKTIPSWFIYGSGDTAIPPAELAFMAKRAHSRKTVVVPGGSHVTLISHPHAVSALIEAAAVGR